MDLLKQMDISTSKWERGAQSIIENIAKIDQDLPTVIFLRHSAREEPDDFEETLRAPLTEEGRLIAQEFGSKLPSIHDYRFFSSPVERCKETAILIEKRLKQRNVQIHPGAILPNLTHIENNRKLMMEYFKRDGKTFVDKWIAGFYPDSVVEPPIIVAQRIAEDIVLNFEEKPKNLIDLFISHDFHLLVILFYWTGILATKEWIDYLGGFILQFDDDLMYLYYNHSKKEIFYPYWLKQMLSL